MKILHFGYNNSSNHFISSTQEGLGLKKDGKLIGPTYGELIEVINYYSEVYIIYKVIKAFDNNKDYIGKYEVRRAVADIYANGTGTVYIDSQKDFGALKLESIINSLEFQDKISQGISFNTLLNVSHNDSYAFDGALKIKDNETVSVCALSHDAFENKKRLLKMCLSSMADMQEKIELTRKLR